MNTNFFSKMQISVSIKFLRLSSLKVQRILNQIRNKSVVEAMILLEFMPYKACKFIWQLLYSAIKNLTLNYNLKLNNLCIYTITVSKGPIRKKVKFLSKGRIGIIKKKTCHINLTVGV